MVVLFIWQMDGIFQAQWVNSLAPGKFAWNFRYIILKRILMIDGWGISCEIALIWILDFTDDKSTLVQVMAWCHQATSHYLSHCWPRSLSPYGVTRPHWVSSFGLVTPYGIIIGSHDVKDCCLLGDKPLHDPYVYNQSNLYEGTRCN